MCKKKERLPSAKSAQKCIDPRLIMAHNESVSAGASVHRLSPREEHRIRAQRPDLPKKAPAESEVDDEPDPCLFPAEPDNELDFVVPEELLHVRGGHRDGIVLQQGTVELYLNSAETATVREKVREGDLFWWTQVHSQKHFYPGLILWWEHTEAVSKK